MTSSKSSDTNLHGTSIDEKTVQLLERIGSAICLVEDDGSNSAADAVGSIGDGDTLDARPHRFGKVFLDEREIAPISPPESEITVNDHERHA